jgi:hypothetical protein
LSIGLELGVLHYNIIRSWVNLFACFANKKKLSVYYFIMLHPTLQLPFVIEHWLSNSASILVVEFYISEMAMMYRTTVNRELRDLR